MPNPWEKETNREELAIIAAVSYFRLRELALPLDNPCEADFARISYDPWSIDPVTSLSSESGWDNFCQIVTRFLSSRMTDHVMPGIEGSRLLSDIGFLMSALEEPAYVFSGNSVKETILEVASLRVRQDSWQPLDATKFSDWRTAVRQIDPHRMARETRTERYRELFHEFWQFTAVYNGDYFDPVIRWALQTKPLCLIFKLPS